jgi:WD40 repeat protein
VSTVTLIDTATWSPTGPPIEPGVPVFTTIWSPDSSSVLFTSDATEEVSVWSALDRRLLAILTPGPGGARSAAFSPGGTRVAIGSADGQIVFYDPAGWRPLGEPVAVGAAVIVSMSYSPDGRSLVVGAHDGTIRLLDAITRKPIGPPIPGANIQNAFVRWIPGERIAVGFGDGSILSYDADQDAWIRRACSTAGRQLTQAEWDAALPGRPYQRTCR